MRSPKPQLERTAGDADFFNVELSLSFTLADLAATSFRAGHNESGDHALEKAQEGCDTIQRYLADERHTRHLNKKEHDETTTACERLRERIGKIHQLHRTS